MNATVYSKSGCPYCIKIISILAELKVPTTVYSLDFDFTRDEFLSKFGKGSTFPRVFINEELIGGTTETIEFLYENGKI